MEKGQMIRFWSQLFRHCRRKGYVIPTIKGGNAGMQLGAVNLMPDVAYYTDDPIAVLGLPALSFALLQRKTTPCFPSLPDFASLYPSIIIAHNLCYSTLIHVEDKKHFQPDQLTEGATGAGFFYFVKDKVKKGIVPEILETFLSERQKAKKMMEETADPDMKVVLDGSGFLPPSSGKVTVDFAIQRCLSLSRSPAGIKGLGQRDLWIYGGPGLEAPVSPHCRVHH